MKLSNADIMKLIPGFMRDDEAVEALAKAINELITEPGGRVKQLRVWDKIDELDDVELDELAWELNVDWYSSALELDRKRETIKVSDQVHSKRGTKWAVEQLVSAYFGSGYVEEWFNAGYPFEAAPFHFIVLTAKRDMTDGIFQEFNRVANAAKSVRSIVDGIFYLGEYNVVVLVSSTVEPTVFDLTRCGTKHKSAYIGRIMEQAVEAGQSTTRQAFDIIKAGVTKAGLGPKVATIGLIITAAAATAGAAITNQSFNFIKCGTHKTMQ